VTTSSPTSAREWEGIRGARLAQVAAIVEDARLADVPVVVAGDCSARNSVLAAFQAAGFELATRGAGHTIGWFAWDHVFVRRFEAGVASRTGAIDTMVPAITGGLGGAGGRSTAQRARTRSQYNRSNAS
jgi:hypothetical protein